MLFPCVVSCFIMAVTIRLSFYQYDVITLVRQSHVTRARTCSLFSRDDSEKSDLSGGGFSNPIIKYMLCCAALTKFYGIFFLKHYFSE